MNILLMTTHLNTGGITSYLLTLIQGLKERGHRVVVVSSGGHHVPHLEDIGAKHIQMNIRTKSELHPKLWMALPGLKQLLIQENIHIIHAQTRVTQVLGFWLSRSTKVPMVTTCHGFFRPHFFRRWLSCWGKAVIAISRPVKEHLQKDFHVKAELIHLILNGVDLKRFKMPEGPKAQNFTIGIIARLSNVKAIDVLIKAMPRVLKDVPGAKLSIVGEGPQEGYLRDVVHSLALEEAVSFYKTERGPEDILPQLDLFVMPSRMEGLGLSVMEAQACGVPVIVSNVGGLVDLVEDGVTGYLVPSGDQQCLALRIIDVFINPAKARSMAHAARIKIEKCFSAEGMAQETLKVYEQYSRR